MLHVKTPEEVLALIEREFETLAGVELVSLSAAMGRVLAEDIAATEYVPDFDRSTVDGYAVRARDTFGCTDAIPAILPLQGEVLMGEGAEFTLNPEECVDVTGRSQKTCGKECGRIERRGGGQSCQGKGNPAQEVRRRGWRCVLQFGNEQQADREILSPESFLQGHTGAYN